MDTHEFQQSVSAELRRDLATRPHPDSILYGRLMKYDPRATWRAAYGAIWREEMERHERQLRRDAYDFTTGTGDE